MKVDEILAPVTAEKIPSTLSGRFTEEKEIDSIKKKEKQEAHMYLGVTVITDEQFNGHQGSGLLDPENVAYRTVKVKRSLTWPKLNSRISEYFGVPDGTFRIWIFKKKHDQDVWRPEPLEEEDTSEREIKDFQQVDPSNFAVWLEISPMGGQIQDFNTKNDLLVFLRLYEPETASLCYCGHVIVPTGLPLKELIPVMNKRAKWKSEVKSVLMWEDRAQGDCKNLDDLEKSLEQALTELQDGAVIIFQKNPHMYNPPPRLRNVAEYFRDQANRQDVIFVNRDTPNENSFKVRLNQREHYKEMAEVAGKVLNRDPRLIQFFKPGPFNRDQAGAPIKSTEKRNIEEILYVATQSARDTRRSTKTIYYQNIDIPIEDFESKKTIPIKFIHTDMTDEDIIVHINKNATVSDLLRAVREKMAASLPVPERRLRLIEYMNSRIVTIHLEAESTTEIITGNKNFRVETVPTDQLEFEPGEVLIQVCHFSGVVQSTFGIPFLLKLKNQEQIVDVRHRIQKTLEISDKDFAKWKMALVQNSQAKYYSELNDHETVATNQFYVQTRDGAPLVQHRVWIGLDHPNRQKRHPLKPVYTEKPIKIHN